MKQEKIDELKNELRKYTLDNLIKLKNAGVQEVQILATNDSKCCSICRASNGKVMTVSAALKQAEVVTGCKNEWCRCTYLAVIK